MFFTHWIIGPQFLGMIFLLAGLIQRWYPPKKINALYGYRTESSMKDQQSWDEANRYSTALMIRYAWIMIIAGAIITLALAQLTISEDAYILSKVGLMIGGAVVMVVFLIRSTEKHLKNFSNKP